MEALKGLRTEHITNYQAWPAAVWILLLTTAVSLLALVFWRPSFPKNAPKFSKADDWPLVGALRFFSDRRNFLLYGTNQSQSGSFSFYLGKYRIVAVSGPEGRKAFFDSKELSMPEGYATLYAAAPSNDKAIKVTEEETFHKWFGRTINALLRKETLAKNLVPLVDDSRKALDRTLARAGSGGLFDPFEDIYRIVYQLTMRTVGATEFAESPKMLEKTLHWFEVIESSTSATRIIFPWLPTPGYIRQMIYGARIYTTLNRVMNERKKTGRRVEDSLQFLMDSGANVVRILTFIMSSLFAGQLNSGINAAWMLIYLAADPYWYRQLRDEVDGVVKKHRKSPEQSGTDVLAGLTMADWESDFPLIDLALRETIRLQMVGAAFRKNISGKDYSIGKTGEVVPEDSYVTYPVDDVHFNPEIYPEPAKWDPGRYLPDRAEDKKAPWTYMGLGFGQAYLLYVISLTI
ncbi:cytochrome P450 6A1 [Apodospora peruviana]|uniref:Cytochrome P450 6A1 n=1 Tax=Apodospora peruviana TaxID=516989 RepID=A0AAE0IJN4_9PEZI|nr:cytochrome P450 6A1 [Apodospora peruviana]